MANTVKLTFTGEEKPLVDSFDRVGDSSKRMGDEVGESGDAFGRAAETTDEAEKKTQGFADTLDGTTQAAEGFGQIMKGDVIGGLITVGGGLASLSGGLTDFLIPALGKAKAAVLGMNFAFLSSPVFWIIAAIVLLIAAIVLIATKTDWFQRAWRASWNAVKTAAANVWNWIKQIPGWIQSAFGKVAGFILAPYRAAFNGIARAWNATIGSLSFTFPSWIPGIGGKGFNVPNLPTFHSGVGRVPGTDGAPVMAMLQGGEEVRSRASAGGGDGGIVIGSDGSRVGDALVDLIASAVRKRGGDPGQLGIKAART